MSIILEVLFQLDGAVKGLADISFFSFTKIESTFSVSSSTFESVSKLGDKVRNLEYICNFCIHIAFILDRSQNKKQKVGN